MPEFPRTLRNSQQLRDMISSLAGIDLLLTSLRDASGGLVVAVILCEELYFF